MKMWTSEKNIFRLFSFLV